ncbi:Laminin subunit alpha-5 [Taenia solium]|eukprot:TsM_000544800 transcript=TsM_000544800 gene=TsM_000544800
MENNLETFDGLLDQALGNPEPGAVNFNILHRLISALLKRLNLSNASVADGSSTNPAINLDNFQVRLSSLEESISHLNSQSIANEVEQDRDQRINSIDSELQKTTVLVNDLAEIFAAFQAKQSSNSDEAEKTTDIGTRVQEMEQTIDDLSRLLGVQKEEGQITSVLSENEKAISKLQQRIEQVENSLDILNKSKLSISDSDAFVALSERVEGLNDLVTSQLPNKDNNGDVPKSSLKVCIESLKMVISEVKEELERMDDAVKNMQENLASIAQEKVSKLDLEGALQMIEAKNDNANVDERNELKGTMNTLSIDVADVCQRVIDIERFIKTNFGRLASQMKEKADKAEVTAAQARMTSELQKFALRLRLSASNVLLENGKLRDEAAGIRKKMILHCISCDRPLLIEGKRRGNFQGNYIDPPYIRNRDKIYDVYRMKRGTGGVYTTLKANEVKPSTLKTNSESGEISPGFDVALPDETGTIAPSTSPKQSDDESELPEL